MISPADEKEILFQFSQKSNGIENTEAAIKVSLRQYKTAPDNTRQAIVLQLFTPYIRIRNRAAAEILRYL